MKQIPIDNFTYQALPLSSLGPINRFWGVSTLDPFNFKPGTAAGIKNLTASGANFPALVTRSAFAQLGSAIGSVKGITAHKATDLHAVAGGIWYKWTGTAWVQVLAGLNASAAWSFTNFQGNLAAVNLIAVNGVDTPRKYDGTTATTLTGLPAGVNFKMIDQHDNRLYASDGKTVFHSALRKPQDWTTVDDAGQIAVESFRGEDITTIKAGMKHLMMFKRNMFAELFGNGPFSYQMQTVSETGAVGLNAVTVRDQTTYWIHDSGAFQYTGGLPRKDFSVPVSGYFANMNKAAAQNACVTATQESVLFSIPTGSSTVNDTTLEYMPDFGIWSVWQDFSPAVWTYWNNAPVYGNATGVFQQTNDASTTAWEWISPPFGGSTTHSWYKMWHVIDLPPGSSMNVYVSRKAEGNSGSDWIQVQSIIAGTDYPGDITKPAIAAPDLTRPLAMRRVIIPLQQVANSNWLRVKFQGTGAVKFHEIDIQQRQLPLK